MSEGSEVCTIPFPRDKLDKMYRTTGGGRGESNVCTADHHLVTELGPPCMYTTLQRGLPVSMTSQHAPGTACWRETEVQVHFLLNSREGFTSESDWGWANHLLVCFSGRPPRSGTGKVNIDCHVNSHRY